MRTLEELINKEEPGWDLVQEWMQEATNPYEVLPRDAKRAEAELLNAQLVRLWELFSMRREAFL